MSHKEDVYPLFVSRADMAGRMVYEASPEDRVGGYVGILARRMEAHKPQRQATPENFGLENAACAKALVSSNIRTLDDWAYMW